MRWVYSWGVSFIGQSPRPVPRYRRGLVSNAFAPARYPILVVELRTIGFDPVRLGGDIALNPSGVQRDGDLRESQLLVRPRPPRGRARGGRAAFPVEACVRDRSGGRASRFG